MRYHALREGRGGAEVRAVTLQGASAAAAKWVAVGSRVVHGPSRLLAAPRIEPSGEHTHQVRVWPDGTPALAVVLNGDLDDVWLIPFEQGGP